MSKRTCTQEKRSSFPRNCFSTQEKQANEEIRCVIFTGLFEQPIKNIEKTGGFMNDKQMQLIQAGIKLFAGKGYYHTSIQEIATEAGVSKGSFYIYFQSKEEFIAKAFQYFYNQLTERLGRVKNENLPPRKVLAKQITVLM